VRRPQQVVKLLEEAMAKAEEAKKRVQLKHLAWSIAGWPEEGRDSAIYRSIQKEVEDLKLALVSSQPTDRQLLGAKEEVNATKRRIIQEVERPSLPKIPAEEDTRLDPGSGTEETVREVVEEVAGTSGLEKDTVKEVERPSLPTIPAEEDTRLDPGSGTEETGREVERPSLPQIPAEEDTRLDPGSGTERGEAKGQEKSGRPHGGKRKGATQRPYAGKCTIAMGRKDAKKVYDAEEEADEAIEEGRKMLWAWAADQGMPDAQKRQNVGILLANLRSRANAYIPHSEVVACNRVIQCVQAEVNIILAGRAAEEEAEGEAGSSGSEEESEEEEAEEEAAWDFEDFSLYRDSEEDSDEEEESEGEAEEEAEEEAGSSAQEEEAAKEEERPSPSKIPAEEYTRLAPGSVTAETDQLTAKNPAPKSTYQRSAAKGSKLVPREVVPYTGPRLTAAEELSRLFTTGPYAEKAAERPPATLELFPPLPRAQPGTGKQKAATGLQEGLKEETKKDKAEEKAGSSAQEEDAVGAPPTSSGSEAGGSLFGSSSGSSGAGAGGLFGAGSGDGSGSLFRASGAGAKAGPSSSGIFAFGAWANQGPEKRPTGSPAESEAVKQKDVKAMKEGPGRKNNTSSDQCLYFGSAKGCRFGADCRSKHEDPTFVGPCKYQAYGHCQYEGRCFFRHTDLDKPRKEKHNDASGAAAEVAAKEARRYAAEERRKGYDEGFEQGVALEKAKAEGFEQGVAFARDCAKQAARATAEEGEQRKAATESRKVAEERLAALASETATALQKKRAKDKELAKAEEAKAKAKKKSKEKGKKQERKKKREQEDAQGPSIPKPPYPHTKTSKARWSPSAATSALALLLVVLAAYSGAAQEQGSSMATEMATRKVTHHQTTALSRFLSDDARYEARPDYAPSKTQNREVVPLWRICWACLGVGLFLGSWRTSGFYCGRTPATAEWRTVRAEGLVARCAMRSARLWKPWLRLNSGTGSGSCERASGAWGAGRADLPAGRSAPAAPD
jgi:hypothetical protein